MSTALLIKLVLPLSSKDSMCLTIVGSLHTQGFQNMIIGTSKHPQPVLVNLNGALLITTSSFPKDFLSSFTTTDSIHFRSFIFESNDLT